MQSAVPPRKLASITLVSLVAAGILYLSIRTDTLAAEQSEKGGPAASRGELVYVPIYSSMMYDNGKRSLEVAATLSIHNINPDRPIRILRADYHATDGKLIKRYLDKPLVLGALQTSNVFIEKSNTAGGIGANFVVEWDGDAQAVSPLIEGLMVNASSNLGIAFTTTGKVIRATGGN
jgi:hypothetical protein